MYVISSYGEVQKLMKELSLKLRCGERINIHLTRIELLTKAISEARVNGLSVINAYEDGDYVVVTIENRFSSYCSG